MSHICLSFVEDPDSSGGTKMPEQHKNCFYFSRYSYFDMISNTIVDTNNGIAEKYTPVSGAECSVLRKLILEYPHAVPKEQLCTEISASCGEAEVRRVIDKLRKHHPQLNLWIPRARQGEYRLLAPAGPAGLKSPSVPSAQHDACILKNTGICVRPHFVHAARKDIFHQLDVAFLDSHVVFLQGIGGIGKSEIAKHWALQKKRDGTFNTVVFAQLNTETNSSNVLSLITNDTVFVIGGEFHYRDEEETIEAYFQRKLAKIKQITDERTLIIIDNYDIDDQMMASLFTGTYSLLVTTRNRPGGYDFPIISVSEIQDPQHLKQVFFNNLDGDRVDIQADDPYIEKLFSLVSNHTLAIEIIAKSFVNSADTPESLYWKISSPAHHALIQHVDGMVERSFSDEPQSAFDCIRLLFSLSRLENDSDYTFKSQVLVFMAAMPTRGIELSLFNKWSNSIIIRAKNSLVRKSWLRQDTVNGVTLVSMHPLIREIVWSELKPSLDQCSSIIDKLIQEDSSYIDYLHNQPKNTKDCYEQIGVSLLSAFPLINLQRLDFYIKLQRIFHTCANPEAALGVCTQLKQILEQENKTETWQYGFVTFRIGAVYSWIFRVHSKEAFQKGLELMESYANTNEEKMWLALCYRETASLDCRDEFLFHPHDPSYIDTIEHLLNKGEKIVLDLQKNGFRKTNLDLFYGTLCVWRSRIAIYRGDLDLATALIDTAESEFIKFGYPNTLDKHAVADVRALICAARGNYDQQIAFILEAVQVFEAGFGVYHRSSLERAIQLATAYQKNQQPDEAANVLTKYKKVAIDMLGENAPLTVRICNHLEELEQL